MIIKEAVRHQWQPSLVGPNVAEESNEADDSPISDKRHLGHLNIARLPVSTNGRSSHVYDTLAAKNAHLVIDEPLVVRCPVQLVVTLAKNVRHADKTLVIK